jgi:ABC-type uncharacterized transport system permease subunit
MPRLLAVLLMGGRFEEHTKKAFDFASETTKQMITLSTAVIGITITFRKDIVADVSGWGKAVLAASWFFYLVSIVLGIGTLMNLAGNLERPQGAERSIYAGSIRLLGGVQAVAFALAILLTIIFGAIAIF